MNKSLQTVFFIPPEYQDYRIKDFLGAKKKVVVDALECVSKLINDHMWSEGKYVFVYGQYRTIKTSFAAAVLNAWININNKYTYFATAKMLMDHKYHNDETFVTRFDEMMNSPFILIDDLYVPNMSNGQDILMGSVLEDFFRYRSGNNFGGIITSKYPLDKIGQKYGQSLSSLLKTKIIGEFNFDQVL